MKKFFTLIIMLVLLLLVGCTTVTNVTVVFDSNGGSQVGAIVVKKGGTINEPTPPTYEDHEFLGWYLNEEIFDFNEPINESIVLVAEWEYIDNTIYYSVKFKDYDGTILKEEQVAEGKNATAPVDPTREGYNFIGWSISFKNVKSDLDVIAQYKEIKKYIVSFVDYDGTILKQEYVEEGKSATPPTNPTREGYTFTGWSQDSSVVNDDMIISAKYIEDGKPTYTVTFKDYDGKVLKEETVEEAQWATAPANPTREGYTFTGWDISFDNVTSDLVVTAQYKETIKYTVTFKDYDGTILKRETVEEGKSATPPTDPTRYGYTFTGWDKEFDVITGSITIFAQYEASSTFTVVFKDHDGTILKEETVLIGNSATAPDAPEREGYTFTGWNNSFSNVTSDLEITAQYEKKDSGEYAITYELNGGTWGYSSKNEMVLNFLNDFYVFVKPSDDYNAFVYGTSTDSFLGSWKNYIGGSVSDNNKLICEENDLTISNDEYFFNSSQYKEKWSALGLYVKEKICATNKRFGYSDVSYNYGALDFYRYMTNDPGSYVDIYGGEDFYKYPYENQPTLYSYKVSTTSIELPKPLSDTFKGWYLNSDFSGTPITEIAPNTKGDLTLYACWDNTVTYEIIFDTDGGSAIDPMTVTYNQTVTLPTNISKVDHAFKEWQLNGEAVSNLFVFEYRTTIILKAKWIVTNVGLTNLEYDGSSVKYRNLSTVVQIPTAYVQPETQLRAAWVTSIVGGHFTPSSNKSTMMNNLQEVLDIFDKYNLNCMIFHIRAMNDAFYKTDMAPIESKYGTYETFEQWDYLEWLISECHKRGIEFHAWLNPYRIKSYGYSLDTTEEDVAATYSDYPKNPASDPDNILMTYRSDGTQGAILNPCKEEVQDFIVDVCLEVMQNYDVDAIHFDDYFYAQMSSGVKVLTEPDQDDYEAYISANPNCGYSSTSATNKKQWRRDNVDNFIYKLSVAMTDFNIQNGRGVQLGIAPTGIYRNGDGSVNSGSNTGGQEHYNSYLFCDTKKWVDEEWIDYIMPQSYWAFTHASAGYADVMDWWNKVVEGKNVNLYSGLGIYMSIDGGNYSWGRQPYEVSNQVLYTTKLSNVKGVSIYSFGSLRTIDSDSSQIAYQGLQRLLNEYWTEKVPTPLNPASQYIK